MAFFPDIFRRGIRKALSLVAGSSLMRLISEPFAGAWQRGSAEKRGDLITYHTLYACIHRIAADIGKLPFSLRKRTGSGVWKEVAHTAQTRVLEKPNSFQTAAQFREYWRVT